MPLLSNPQGWSSSFLDSMRGEGDPAADEAVRRLYENQAVDSVNRLLGSLLANDQAEPSGLPDEVREYLEITAELPPWADADQIAAGQVAFEQYGALALATLASVSLPACYVSGSIARVLGVTQKLEDHAVRRIFETAQFTVDVMSSGGLGPAGRGIRSAQKVRLMHAAIRKLTLDPPPRDGGSQAGFPGLLEQLRWEAADLVPINQEDLAYTLQTFCWVVIRTLRKTGVDFLPTETSAFIHAWNVTGHLMGIRAELLPESEDEARELFENIRLRRRERTREGRELTAAILGFIGGSLREEPFLKPFFRIPGLDNNLRLSRMIVYTLAKDDETPDLLGIAPLNRWERLISYFTFRAVRRLISAEDAAADDSVLLGFVRWRIGRLVVKHLIRRGREWKNSMFDIPDALRDDWLADPAARD